MIHAEDGVEAFSIKAGPSALGRSVLTIRTAGTTKRADIVVVALSRKRHDWLANAVDAVVSVVTAIVKSAGVQVIAFAIVVWGSARVGDAVTELAQYLTIAAAVVRIGGGNDIDIRAFVVDACVSWITAVLVGSCSRIEALTAETRATALTATVFAVASCGARQVTSAAEIRVGGSYADHATLIIHARVSV